MGFRNAVTKTPELQGALRQGLQALNRAARNKITTTRSRALRGSVDLDGHLKGKYPNAARWDYAIGVARGSQDDKVVYAELHPAHTSKVKTVLKKRKWLRSWIEQEAPKLKMLPASYHWIATSGVHISKSAPQFRILAQSGIRLSATLDLTGA